MPKPPILIPPLPKEPIASAAWGDPVTVAVNGLLTGKTRIGCIIYTETGGQSANSTFAPVTISTAYILYDSDAFVDVPGNRFVVPPNLGGIYEVDWSISATSYTSGSGMRLSIRRNGTSIYQAQHSAAYNSQFSLGFQAKMKLNAGDSIQAYVQAGTTQPLMFKAASMIRIGDLPAVTGEEGEEGAAVGKPAPEPEPEQHKEKVR
jgi:hypothetical protein